MPIIRLPDHLRDGIISALGNELGHRIKKGHAVAIFTYQCSETGEHEYTVEFKNTENAKTLASYQGHGKGTKAAEAIPLYPDTIDVAQALAENSDIGDGIFVLRRIPSEGGGPPDFRVEFTPPGASAVYLAVEAKANEGQTVAMQRVALNPNQKPRLSSRLAAWATGKAHP